MSQPPTLAQSTQVDPDDLDKNPNTDAPHLRDLVEARLHRRHVLKGGVGAMTMAGLGTLGLAAADEAQAIAGNANDIAKLAVGVTPATELQFTALTKSILDGVRVSPEFDVHVIYATGDSISPDVPEYTGSGEEMQYDRRAGDHHDGMHFFPLDKKGRRDDDSSEAGLLAVNHENITGTAQFLHPQGETNVGFPNPLPTIQIDPLQPVRPPMEVIKEQDAHGVSIVEMRRGKKGVFARNKASRYNRHVTARTIVEINGPARGSKYMQTKRFPSGMQARGTLNNCGHGVTPWGTYLTAEENWAGYFVRRASDRRDDRTEAAFQRNGLRPNQAGFAHRRWASVSPSDVAAAGLDMSDFERWDTSITGATATDDYRNEFNTFGYIVEIDPYDPRARPRKRTALGRRANEGCWSSIPKAGKPLAFYIGCDSRNEYVYKYVSDAKWVPADGKRGGLDVGDKYLDKGTIYGAVFGADGTGRWEPLTLLNPKVAAGAKAIILDGTVRTGVTYTFEDLADICVNTRLAAGAAGATRMDRPEWTAVNPFNGEVYITMTENPDRGNIGPDSASPRLSTNNVPNAEVDAANPRAYFDTKNASSQGNANGTAQRGNVNGHVVRIRESGDDPGAESFTWDIFLFGAQAAPDNGANDLPNDSYQANVNVSGLSPLNDLSKPDGCWFSPTTGILYIQTDDNTFTDQTNAMLLAAIPGRVGDGRAVTIQNVATGDPDGLPAGGTSVTTRVGRPMTDATFKRILTAPLGAEITGLTETPDGKVLFINVQHPGENTGRAGSVSLSPSNLNGPFESNWPANGLGDAPAYGPGGQTARPRSATLMITRKDGRVIGFDPKKNKGKDKDDDGDDKGGNR